MQSESNVSKQVRIGRAVRDSYFGAPVTVQMDLRRGTTKTHSGSPLAVTNDASSVAKLYGHKWLQAVA